MGLIVVRAKVFLSYERNIEKAKEFENQGLDMPGKWVWRDAAIHTDDIKRLIAYNSKKTIIEGYDGTITLVEEPFQGVYQKWDENKEQEVGFTPDFTCDEEEFEQENDDDNEE